MAAELPAHGGGHVRDLVSRHFACADGQRVIGGVPVSALVARHGTPLYVYDMSVVRRQWQLLRDTLPARFGAFYSVKANPAQVLLRFFVARGAGLEVASAGELHQALAAGCPAERIVFAGPGKREEELALALDAALGEI